VEIAKSWVKKGGKLRERGPTARKGGGKELGAKEKIASGGQNAPYFKSNKERGRSAACFLEISERTGRTRDKWHMPSGREGSKRSKRRTRSRVFVISKKQGFLSGRERSG